MRSPEHDEVVAMLWSFRPKVPSKRVNVPGARVLMEAMAERVAPDVDVEPVLVHDRRAEWLVAPSVDEHRRILYLHGGGYVAGSLNTHRALAARIGRAAGCAVLTLDYRLGPEHKYPAALDDALFAFNYIFDHGPADASERATRVYVGGDSAGGGLALATLLAGRERGMMPADAAFTLSAWTDLAGTGESATRLAERDPMLEGGLLATAGKDYLGDTDARNPFASPLYGSLAGLPPLLMQVGGDEVLLDDTLRFYERAKSAGVDVTLDHWEEMFHVWQYFAARLSEGREAIDRIGTFLRAR